MAGRHEITVVVALIPGGDCIEAALDSLGAQDERRFELIIVDARPAAGAGDGARLGSAAAAAGLDACRVPAPGSSRAAANNLGIRLARTELVLLLAHDFRPGERFVSAHLDLHRREWDRRVVGIGPGLFPKALRGCPFRRWLEDSGEAFGVSFTAPAGKLPRHFFYCANTSAKRRFLFEAGLFDERFPFDAWDDAELGSRLARAGMRSVLVPEAVGWHEHPVTLAERRATMERAGVSAAVLEAKDAGPHGWQAWARRDPRRLLRGSRWRRWLSAVLPGADGLREQAWKLDLEASFAAAYRSARCRLHEDPEVTA